MILGRSRNSASALFSVCLFAAVCSAPTLFAADQSAPPLALFAVPSPALRSIDFEPSEATQISDSNVILTELAPPDTEEIVVEFKRSTGFSEEAYAQIYQGLNGPILARIEPEPEPAGALGWVQVNMWDPIFTLESIKIRKVYVTGSIVTAIQRKNPLCLLNPLILAVDF